MKSVAKKKNSLIPVVIGVFLLLFNSTVFGQNKSEQLKGEQAKLEKKLSNTKSLLDKAKKSTQTSMNELKLIESQYKAREELVQNVDNQIRGAELTLVSKENQVKQLEERVAKLKIQYRKLLLYAYKHRNKHGKMMYIFSANNYFEAVKRNTYLKKIAEIQQKQFKLIQQNQKSIHREMGEISKVKNDQKQLLLTKIQEKELILKDKQLKEKTLSKLKKDEGKLLADLKAAEKQKVEIQKKIKKAIEQEIAATAKKEKEKSSSSKTTNSGGSSSKASDTKASEKKEIVVTETKESLALSKTFESNRGKLPWPTLKGSVVEAYGKNPHPTLAGVYTNNNGIDIGAPKSSQVRAVFEGEVTSVINISGAGKCVIIKHGNYRTVYSNLQEVYVTVGSKVSTKQSIGSLLPESGSELSTAHFEIHQVVDGNVVRLNPSLWLAQ